MRKFYIAAPFMGETEEGIYTLVTEDGLGIWVALCSHSIEAADKLINNDERLKNRLREYLKNGYTVEIMSQEKHEEMFALNQRNFVHVPNRKLYMREVLKMSEEDIMDMIENGEREVQNLISKR